MFSSVKRTSPISQYGTATTRMTSKLIAIQPLRQHDIHTCSLSSVSTSLACTAAHTKPLHLITSSLDVDSIPSTPAEQILPHTGGAYADWEFHPSRLDALLQRELDRRTQDENDEGDGNAVSHPPAEQIRPNTGGAYAQCKFHPSRLQALPPTQCKGQAQNKDSCECEPFTCPDRDLSPRGGFHKPRNLQRSLLQALLMQLSECPKDEDDGDSGGNDSDLATFAQREHILAHKGRAYTDWESNPSRRQALLRF